MNSDTLYLLYSVLECIEKRLKLADRGQVNLVSKVEGVAVRGIVEAERRESSSELHVLMTRLKLHINEHADSERPSQSQIIVNNMIEPPKGSKSSFPIFASARFRRAVFIVAIFVGGSVLGVLYALKVFHFIK